MLSYLRDLIYGLTIKALRKEAKSRPQSDEASLTGWSPSSWINTLLEKHAWFSAGLVWLPGASMSTDVGVYDESPPNDSDARPTISLFEQWEEGAHVPRVANARDYMCPELPMQGIILFPRH